MGEDMNDITIRLNPEGQEPLYKQLYEFIKSEIIAERYSYNTKLPSKRQLSEHLKCSLNTVQAAYSQLGAEGYITAKPKSGYFVCRLEGILQIKKTAVLSAKTREDQTNYQYDFSHRGVDLDSFPFATWRRITKDVINEYDSDLLTTGHSQGNLNLRSSLADYLHNSRGVYCSPEQIIISSGTEFLIQLLIQLFPETAVFAIENPGYEKLNMIFKSNRAHYRAIPLDDSGLQPDKLLESHANIACITPSHQFPTGTIMPVSRRIQLINWANEKPERYIIEDDYDSEFKYGGKPIPSLQGMDAGEKVIYIGALSKSLTPAIRVSYMVLPEQLMKIYHSKLMFYICPVPTIEQKTLLRFIEEGYFERHLNRMRKIYKEKRETLVSAIHSLLPDAEIKGATAGLHMVLKINNGMIESELIAAASRYGVRVYGYSQYFFDTTASASSPALLLGFATMRMSEIFGAVDLLRKAWF